MPLANIDRVGVSVVICCYNSSSRIIATLKHLSLQKNITFPWEVLLIDNNSSDNTASFANEYWSKNSNEIPLRIVKEPSPGTMIARQTGIISSRYRYLLFCDDDNWLNESYIHTAFTVITQNENIAAVGGMGILAFENEKNVPFWIDKYKNNFGAGPQGSADGDITYAKGCLYTAGAILDRKWLNRLYNYGFVSSLKGRDGKSLVAGEDTELTLALKLIGGKLYYSSKMSFQHYMTSGRMNWQYLERLHESFGFSDLLLSPYYNFLSQKKIPPVASVISKAIKNALIGSMRAASVNFGEDKVETLRLHRYKGALKAAIGSAEIYRANKKQVNLLSERSLKDPPLSITN